MTKSPKLTFIKAIWHSEIVDQALLGFNQRRDQLQVLANVDVFDVPGAFELPLLAQNLANTVEYDAIIAAAFVVDGGIYRHDFVAQAVITGLMEVGTRTGVPVLSVSLTPHNFQSTDAHVNFFKEHFVKKGAEAADAAIEILRVYDSIIKKPNARVVA